MDTLPRGAPVRGQTYTGDNLIMCAGEAEAQVVVPVRRGVVVAIGCAQVPRVVVPTAATVHPVRAALRPQPLLPWWVQFTNLIIPPRVFFCLGLLHEA